MSKLLVIVGALAISVSGLLSATKCDDAKSYLDSNRANLIPTFSLETPNEIVKLSQKTAIETLGVLDRAIERKHQFICGIGLRNIKQAVTYVEDYFSK